MRDASLASVLDDRAILRFASRMVRSIVGLGLVVGGVSLFLGGCSSSTGGGNALGSGGTGTGATGGSSAGGSGGEGAILNLGGASGSGTGGGTTCASGDTEDKDQDGFTTLDGDCNDCDANANPGAAEVDGNGVDEDCDGTADNGAAGCDSQITDVGDSDANNGARAIGLCNFATAGDKKWGVLSANWVMADGTPGMADLSHGMLTGFGPNVNAQEGTRLLALSSGTARQPNDPGYQDVGGAQMGTTSSPPAGFPMDSPACSVFTAGSPANDPAGLQLVIRAPTNAKSFSFKFSFYTYEWPNWVCSIYNDFFVALQSPPPANAVNANISFDTQGNPVSVNNGFLDACSCGGATPCQAGGKSFPCSLGPGILAGTGFGADTAGIDHASTGWLETTSPVDPGTEITMRFTVFDEGDHVLDSSVLIDDFKFSADPATGSTTKPVPVPK
jgi:Putative metal-binding motif